MVEFAVSRARTEAPPHNHGGRDTKTDANANRHKVVLQAMTVLCKDRMGKKENSRTS